MPQVVRIDYSDLIAEKTEHTLKLKVSNQKSLPQCWLIWLMIYFVTHKKHLIDMI